MAVGRGLPVVAAVPVALAALPVALAARPAVPQAAVAVVVVVAAPRVPSGVPAPTVAGASHASSVVKS